MKLYQLKKGERFRAIFHDPNTDQQVLEVTGTFWGADGMYCKVCYDGIEYPEEQPWSYLSIGVEVEKLVEQ
jgi:hypothetical protein